MASAAPERVASLDLIRGVAILGILAINIAGFAGPIAGISNPHYPDPGSLADEIAFAAKFLVFEGKMRALFTILFGASLVLFVERSDAAGRFGDLLQLRRLAWLALIGLAHFFLLWWGDILFLYAVCGLVALLLRELKVRMLVTGALAIFLAWHVAGAAIDAPAVIAEQRVAAGTASADQLEAHAAWQEAVAEQAAREYEAALGGFAGQAAYQLSHRTLEPVFSVLDSAGETLPLMLIGIALYRTGFFTGGWRRESLAALALWGTLSGLALTVAVLAWAWTNGFPPRAMESAFFYWMALPHLLMAAGYVALLVLAAPMLARTAAGKRLIAAGKTAFSNYIGASLVMTAIFYGWGLGLFGTAGHAQQWLYVLLGWALMLAWSEPWLKRFRRGPLEWTWRSLTERRLLPFRR